MTHLLGLSLLEPTSQFSGAPLPHLTGQAPSFTETSSSATYSFLAVGEVARKRMTKKFSTLLKVTSARIHETSFGESRRMFTLPGRPRNGHARTSSGALVFRSLPSGRKNDVCMVLPSSHP